MRAGALAAILSSAASTPAYSPASLFSSGALGGWYDPSDLTSMFQDSAGTTPAAVNSPVGKINDKSGNGNHLTQATAAARPMLRQSGSLYYLEFDGVDDRLTALFSFAQPFDRVSGLNQISYSNADRFFNNGSDINIGLLQFTPSPQMAMYGGSAVTPLTSDLAISADGVCTERFNGASSSLQINNGTASTGNPGSSSVNGLMIGGRSDNTFFANFRLYGTVMRAGTMTAGEKSQLKTWMGARTGVVV